ncbi:hypothetical protein HUN34_22090 [Acinetobacter bereziniae]|uniref:hypothetical protein n=2 Tax=Acinetobacter bereziniae TaxID=106648 RepID=UPI001580B1AA|nr:hypothetical protein [Acinetobacter bereziniae]NUF63496.1 hypothetical protein [Acinetobacter bereziniae]NUG09870.1 hypothetical protein [Acinetobacter bereziniae]NUG65513.1 hypothetical protein [Acinetobacter bereziniae]NUG69253.1 hypothetical protein [Acinetobacter bereziniae]
MIIEDEHNSSVSAMIFYGISIINTAGLTLKHNINLTVYPTSISAVKIFLVDHQASTFTQSRQCYLIKINSLFPKIESHGASLAIHQAALIIKSLL